MKAMEFEMGNNAGRLEDVMVKKWEALKIEVWRMRSWVVERLKAKEQGIWD